LTPVLLTKRKSQRPTKPTLTCCPSCFGRKTKLSLPTPAIPVTNTHGVPGGWGYAGACKTCARLGKARQGKARQGRAGQGRAGQGRAGQGRAGSVVESEEAQPQAVLAAGAGGACVRGIKRQFGFTKTRYRGLGKSAAQVNCGSAWRIGTCCAGGGWSPAGKIRPLHRGSGQNGRKSGGS
jgi:hypothetical protein